jgi:WD40 repeat protein
VLVAAIVQQPITAYAQQGAPELPSEPILRIEAGQHSAMVNRIDTDKDNKFAVTASDDKTVRVWSLPDGRPLRILRLPIDYGDIGKAYAVAISPDGSTVAVGGWTGPDDHNNIYLFDRASGALKQRLSDLPGVINHLAYSPTADVSWRPSGPTASLTHRTAIACCRATRNMGPTPMGPHLIERAG